MYFLTLFISSFHTLFGKLKSVNHDETAASRDDDNNLYYRYQKNRDVCTYLDTEVKYQNTINTCSIPPSN